MAMDQRLANHLDLVTTMADEAGAAMAEQIAAARKALKAGEAAGVESALKALEEHPKKLQARAKQTRDAIEAGSPTAT